MHSPVLLGGPKDSKRLIEDASSLPGFVVKRGSVPRRALPCEALQPARQSVPEAVSSLLGVMPGSKVARHAKGVNDRYWPAFSGTPMSPTDRGTLDVSDCWGDEGEG